MLDHEMHQHYLQGSQPSVLSGCGVLAVTAGRALQQRRQHAAGCNCHRVQYPSWHSAPPCQPCSPPHGTQLGRTTLKPTVRHVAQAAVWQLQGGLFLATGAAGLTGDGGLDSKHAPGGDGAGITTTETATGPSTMDQMTPGATATDAGDKSTCITVVSSEPDTKSVSSRTCSSSIAILETAILGRHFSHAALRVIAELGSAPVAMDKLQVTLAKET
jgi:hypothetical protein